MCSSKTMHLLIKIVYTWVERKSNQCSHNEIDFLKAAITHVLSNINTEHVMRICPVEAIILTKGGYTEQTCNPTITKFYINKFHCL